MYDVALKLQENSSDIVWWPLYAESVDTLAMALLIPDKQRAQLRQVFSVCAAPARDFY